MNNCGDQLQLTLRILLGLVKAVTGGYKVKYHPEGPDGPEWEADFTPPFKRLDMIKDLEKELGVTLPDPSQFGTKGIPL